MVNEKTGIIAFVPDYWIKEKQSRHHVLEGLSKRYKVLWISPQKYFENFDYKLLNFNKKRIQKVNKNLWCYNSLIPCDYKLTYSKTNYIAKFFSIYNKIWRKLFAKNIKSVLKKMNIEKCILYVWRPDFYWALDYFDYDLSCFHIDDDYSFDPKKDNPISKNEMILIKSSDIVFIHSKTLYKKKGHINKNTFKIPNGVDIESYKKKLRSKIYKQPSDFDLISPPIIGYMGFVKRHINLNLIYNISLKKPEWSFVFIGPIRNDHTDVNVIIDLMKMQSNIYFLGGKSSEHLPNYIKALDVCIMPYLKTNYTKYIYPMKMHEYFACGKPVVSTELENIKEFKDDIYFANNEDDWIEKIDLAIKEDSSLRIKQRKKLAENNSWQNRVDKIDQIFKKFLN